MKGIVEASRKAALRQRDAGIAPPEEESNESALKNPPEGDDEGGVPDYVPEETHDPEMAVRSTEAVGGPEIFGASRAAADQDNQAGPTSKGKEKMGNPSEPERETYPTGGYLGVVAPEILTSVEPNPATSEILTPVNPTPTPTPGEGNVEVGQPGKRKASFSSGRPYPKIPRVVAYVDSSSDDEGEGEGEGEASSVELPETSAGGLGFSPRTDDPTPETMLRAMASGRAYIGEDRWSHFRTGTVSDRLYTPESVPSTANGSRATSIFAAEEVRTLQDQLSSTREALLRAEQNAEDAKSTYEHRIEDLECQALTAKELSKEARLELELQSIDRFKRSPAYDALLLWEFQRGMVSAGEFFKQKNRATDRARANWSLSIRKHVDTSLESLRIQMKEWQAYCKSKGKMPHPMHLEVPTPSLSLLFIPVSGRGSTMRDPTWGQFLVPTTATGWMTRKM
ncbi:hypothetical protein LWI29_000942 [Acer saccharum]|uniref:Uncharacterized protein n=1 Tax=Acer saccharum TaxID=4024 RepID=A0AA39S6I2_ACESA|nr:hypothetical protein LWI29_000942 [Acer saccharum]